MTQSTRRGFLGALAALPAALGLVKVVDDQNEEAPRTKVPRVETSGYIQTTDGTFDSSNVKWAKFKVCRGVPSTSPIEIVRQITPWLG